MKHILSAVWAGSLPLLLRSPLPLLLRCTCLEPRQLMTIFYKAPENKDASLPLEEEPAACISELPRNTSDGSGSSIQTNCLNKITHIIF